MGKARRVDREHDAPWCVRRFAGVCGAIERLEMHAMGELTDAAKQ